MVIRSSRCTSSLFSSIYRAFSDFQVRKNSDSRPYIIGTMNSDALKLNSIPVSSKDYESLISSTKKNLIFGDKMPSGCEIEMFLKEGWGYVDKSKLVYELIDEGGSNFMARPKGFGKSIVMSIIKAIALNSPILSQLEIGKLTNPEVYPVINLDFSRCEKLPNRIGAIIQLEVSRHNSTLNLKFLTDDPSTQLIELLEHYQRRGLSSYILVDEYDTPLLFADTKQAEKT